MRPWTKERVALLEHLVAERKTMSEIAEALGLPRHAVKKACWRRGLKVFRPNEWTPELDDVLKDLLGTYRASVIAARLNRRFGTAFNARAIHGRTQALGLVAQRNTGLYSLWLASEELGVKDTTIAALCKRAGFETHKAPGGWHRFVSEEAMEFLRKAFGPWPEPCVNVKQAARQLGISVSWLRRLYLDKRIAVYRRRREVAVPLSEIERIKREGVGHGSQVS